MMKKLVLLLWLLMLWWCSLSHETNTDRLNHDMSVLSWTIEHTGMIMNHADLVTDEVSFLSEMIPHHQEAIDTSAHLLTQTANTGLKLILVNIMSGQANEIKMMKKRLSDSYSGVDYNVQYMPMMRDTNNITDTKVLEKMYMEDMIVHHQWAIDMANKLLTIMKEQDPLVKLSAEGMAQRQTLKAFAQDIIDTQTREITQFQELLQK